MNKYTRQDLKAFQGEPLNIKVMRTTAKIAEWYSHFNNQVCVSFSGGKDSTVLADLCARYCRVIDVPLYLAFVNTGLEYPEIQRHVRFFADWLREKYEIEVVLDILKPSMRFDEVVRKYGYPVISKEVATALHYARNNGSAWALNKLNGLTPITGLPSEYSQNKYGRYKRLLEVDFKVSSLCCDIMKERPLSRINRKRPPLVGLLACESNRRTNAWLINGCNAFESKSPKSKPMSFWMEQDVLHYIKKHDIPIASVYGSVVYEDKPEHLRMEDTGLCDSCGDKLCTTGCDRTGCIFCGFGAHCEKGEGRFERLKRTHPKQYAYCIGGGEYNEEGIWVPSKEGLGMGHVFDTMNDIYGEGFIRY